MRRSKRSCEIRSSQRSAGVLLQVVSQNTRARSEEIPPVMTSFTATEEQQIRFATTQMNVSVTSAQIILICNLIATVFEKQKIAPF